MYSDNDTRAEGRCLIYSSLFQARAMVRALAYAIPSPRCQPPYFWCPLPASQGKFLPLNSHFHFSMFTFTFHLTLSLFNWFLMSCPSESGYIFYVIWSSLQLIMSPTAQLSLFTCSFTFWCQHLYQFGCIIFPWMILKKCFFLAEASWVHKWMGYIKGNNALIFSSLSW